MPLRSLFNCLVGVNKRRKEDFQARMVAGRFVASAFNKEAAFVQFDWEAPNDSELISAQELREFMDQFP